MEDAHMSDNKVLAAILTVALNSTKPGFSSRRLAEEQWQQVWKDYKRFFEELEKEDKCLDRCELEEPRLCSEPAAEVANAT
jgi:hypothetical protein